MRIGVLVAGALLLAGGWGSTATSAAQSPGGGETLKQLLAKPGEDTALNAGAADFQPGSVRFSFLIIRHNGQAVYRPTARVWVSTGLDAKPFVQTTAKLEPIGIPGESEPAIGGITSLYVTNFDVRRPGTLWILVEPEGGIAVQGIGNLAVKSRTDSPQVGSKAIASKTPTIASTHGNLAALTTRMPPDRALLRYSIAGSLAADMPFVVTFATPKFCQSRTCGPVVDVVDATRKQFLKTDVRFIHVEVYKNNNPPSGLNEWFKQWHLPSEPWTFLVGSDGRIKAKFEGSFSVAELAAAVKRYLIR